jgi:hypothetical protein
MISAYFEESEAPLFLSGFFQTPPRNIHDSEEVEFDVVREDEDIAFPIPNITVSGHHNEASRYTNKSFIPPVYSEVFDVNAFEAIKRRPGVDSFTDPNYQLYLRDSVTDGMRKMERKIRRAIELQCAQVLQGGVLTLIDDASATVYELDYQAKSTHFVDVSTAWAADGSTGAPLTDITALGDVVLKDGLRRPSDLIFGATAWKLFTISATVKEQLENRRMDLGMIVAPQMRGRGANYHGWITAGPYKLNLWTYDGWYSHPETATATPYVTTNGVIMTSGGRMDLTFGSIPRFAQPSRPLFGPGVMPSRFSNGNLSLDMSLAAWITEDGRHAKAEVGTRALAIPTAIDTYGQLYGVDA